MQKKETLISRTARTRTRTSLSSSATPRSKEGRDPLTCSRSALVETKDNLTKRQKIGRGLRLCVNQDGERLYDPEANVLTVIANESYDDAANGLQRRSLRLRTSSSGVITPESFTKVTVKGDDGVEERLGYEVKQVYDPSSRSAWSTAGRGDAGLQKAAAEEGKVRLPADSASLPGRSRRSSSGSPRGPDP